MSSAANEILRCRCRVGESWLADCSRAMVQRLRSSGRGAVCWSVERSTCRCRPIGACDGRRERQAGSRLQDMLQLHRAAPCRPGGPSTGNVVHKNYLPPLPLLLLMQDLVPSPDEKLMANIVLQAQLKIHVAYGSGKDISVYQAIGLQPNQIYIIGKVAKKHRKDAVVCHHIY